MINKKRCILINTKVFKENDLLIKCFTEDDSILSGIVFGGMSKKKINLFQIGNFLNLNIIKKPNRPNSISAELSEPFVSSIIEDRFKLNGLLSIISLINLSIIEGQTINNFFNTTEEFLKYMFYKKKWILSYINYLFILLRIIGYDVNYNENSKKKFFCLKNLEFIDHLNNESILFPHNIFENKSNIYDRKSIVNAFKIFETIFINNHLINMNLHLPNHYLLFKKLILDNLKK